MISVLVLGLLLGMKHALEADHVAAVVSLAGRKDDSGGIVRLGLAWGLGHTVSLCLVVSLVLVFNTVVPEHLAQYLEMVVGIMLILLGGDVLRRMVSDCIHFHIHKHGNEVHFHAHSHFASESHHHGHKSNSVKRAVLVGLIHGLAGSAALVVLSAVTTESAWMGILFATLFGIGSMAGMAVLTLIITLPLGYSACRLAWAHNGLLAVVGITTIIIGASLFIDSGIESGLIG